MEIQIEQVGLEDEEETTEEVETEEVETEESEAEQVKAEPKEADDDDDDEDDDEDEPPRRTRKERRAERARQREERLVAEAKRKAYEEAFQEFQRRAQPQQQQQQQPRQPERAESPEKSQEDWELEALEAQRALLNSEMVRTDTSDERKWAELTDRAAKLQARQQELTIRRIMQQHQQRQPQAPRTDEFTAQLEVMDAEFSDVVGAPDWEVKTRPELDAFLSSHGVDRNDRSARKLGLIRAFLTERKYNRAAPPAGREKLATTRTRTGGTKRAPLSLTQEQKDRAEFIFPDKPPKEAWARYQKQMAKLSDDDHGPREIRI